MGNTGIILPHARGFKLRKESHVRRKPVKIIKTLKKPFTTLHDTQLLLDNTESILDSSSKNRYRLVPEKSHSLFPDMVLLQHSQNNQLVPNYIGPALAALRNNQYMSDYLGSSLVSQMMPQYSTYMQPFSPEISVLPFHVPYPVPIPMISVSSASPVTQPNPVTEQLSSTAPTTTSTTKSTLGITLPTFPTLTLPPAFQNLIATTKKSKKRRKYNSKLEKDELEEEDDSDEDNDDSYQYSRKNSRITGGNKFLFFAARYDGNYHSINDEFDSDELISEDNYEEDQKRTSRKRNNNFNDLPQPLLPKYVADEDDDEEEEEEESDGSFATLSAPKRSGKSWMTNWSR
ncbi:unnamed protein product [Thelazia callipaeda]|uniref:Protein suppressor of variegation 3-7 n=1 Tax=Thelazia callipaeda TaxID=103827 RepID=A0A0N5CZT8_THECL|nr:unnamed protein product [Thelazia callipaeda]